ncbi:helix-turn-helix domain-containing protein [Nostocoides sp. F2B08]|uniref:helix-turn-helix domain-containing protein n=1 Tax=Nostocoides sp. F2B08 TaxID=2653936 RepID=UPI001D058E92|nr:XRE family transcriptional regulator [Tetrasphaera sp. F2B08]
MSTHPSPNEWVGIGNRIRVARTDARMSVRELARRIDVSPSHVSQVELGRASFSVRALYNVVSVLGISMDSLFDETDSRRELPDSGPPASADVVWSPLDDALVVLRAEARPAIPLPGGTRWERLTPKPEVGAEFLEVVYPPALDASGPPQDFIQHSSREYGLVTQGSLTVQVGFDQAVLRPGDSIAFDSRIPHRFWNATAEEVRAVWFIWDRETSDGALSRPYAHAGKETTSPTTDH